MATKTETEENYRRPKFDRADRAAFEEEWNRLHRQYPTKTDGDINHPKFMSLLGINNPFILWGESIHEVCTENTEDELTVEVLLVSAVTDLLQTKVDLSNPDMIREFALLFRRTLRSYAVRYGDYINASLGEIDEKLYSADTDPLKLKRILFLTAFYTKSCLTSGGFDSINHIDHKNHTIEYQSRKIIQNAIQCIINKELTDDSYQQIQDGQFVFADAHVRGGTKDKGNSFADFYTEVNEDPALSSFCETYADELTLKTPLVFDRKRITSCTPILIDMMLGICNFSLYAAYVQAMTNGKMLYINLASDRSKIIFQPNNDGTYTYGPQSSSNVARTSLIPHPNSIQSNLTNEERTFEHMQQLDRGMSTVFTPLVGVSIRVKNGDGEEEMTFPGGESDFFQRLYNHRLYGDDEGAYDCDIDFKRLEEVKKEMEEREAELKKEETNLKELAKKARVAEKEVNKATRMIETAQKKKKREEENKKKREEENKKRREEENKKANKAEEKLNSIFGRKG